MRLSLILLALIPLAPTATVAAPGPQASAGAPAWPPRPRDLFHTSGFGTALQPGEEHTLYTVPSNSVAIVTEFAAPVRAGASQYESYVLLERRLGGQERLLKGGRSHDFETDGPVGIVLRPGSLLVIQSLVSATDELKLGRVRATGYLAKLPGPTAPGSTPAWPPSPENLFHETAYGVVLPQGEDHVLFTVPEDAVAVLTQFVAPEGVRAYTLIEKRLGEPNRILTSGQAYVGAPPHDIRIDGPAGIAMAPGSQLVLKALAQSITPLNLDRVCATGYLAQP